MKRVAASKFGVTPSMSGAANDRALTKAYASVDDDTQIYFRPETYQLADPVRIKRGKTGFQGVQGTLFQYFSSWDPKSTEVGQAVLVGEIGSAVQPSDVYVGDFTVEDLNPSNLPDNNGHQPSAIEVYWADNVTIRRVWGRNVKGNGFINVLGQLQSNFKALTETVTIQECGIDGGATQGDFANVGGVKNVYLLDCQLPKGGIGRHFYEGGTGTETITATGNRVNLNHEGKAGFASLTVLVRAFLGDNWIFNWGTEGAAISNSADLPDWSQGDVLPIRNLTSRGNIYSSPGGLAAVQMLTAEIYNHIYEGDHYDCILPFYIAAPNKGSVRIRGNTTSDRVGSRKIAAVPGVTVDSDWTVEAA